jgi:cytochrome c biogenesis protein CcmG/thiol:disulfide interchange protein DsbE
MQETTAQSKARDAGRKPQPKRSGTRALWVPLLVFAALVVLFSFALQKGDPSKLPSALVGRPAPSLMLPPVEGLTDQGRPVPGFGPAELAASGPKVVNFFASWCLPCTDEHPLLLRLKRETGVTILGINHKDQPSNAHRFLARLGNPYTAVGADQNGRAAIEWGVYGMPETFVVDGRGVIVFKHVGPIDAEALATRLIPAVKAAAAAK